MSITQPSTVDELLNYRLSTLLTHSGALTTRLCEGRFGITRREWRVIALLASNGSLSPTELSACANLEPDRISRLFASLRDKGLARRITDRVDRRRARIELTPQGLGLYQQMFPLSIRLHKAVLGVLNGAERKMLDDLLSRLTDHARGLNAQVEGGPKADRRHGGSRRIAGRAAGRAGLLFPQA